MGELLYVGYEKWKNVTAEILIGGAAADMPRELHSGRVIVWGYWKIE